MTISYLTRPYAPPLPEAYLGERRRLYKLMDAENGVRVEVAGRWRLGTLVGYLSDKDGETAYVVVSGETTKVRDSESRAHPNGRPAMREFEPSEVREA